MHIQYPMYGLDLTNRVQFAGVESPDGAYRPVRSCDRWIEFLAEGRYDYVVIDGEPDLDEWTVVNGRAELIATMPLGIGIEIVNVYRLDPSRLPPAC
jgi:hypothetical protein